MTTNYRWTIRFSLLTPLLLIIAVFLMGGGHGWFEPAMAIFPWGMVGIIWQDRISIPFIIMGVLQYPIYGILIDKTKDKAYSNTMAFLIIVMHLILAGLVIYFSGEQWK